MKTAFFRVDSSSILGTGHLNRCLTLAKSLSHNGVLVHFICNESSQKIIGPSNFTFHYIGDDLPQDQDILKTSEIIKKIDGEKILIVDLYSCDATYEKSFRPFVKSIVVIDDLANRSHDCDLLVDVTYGREARHYQKLVSKDCQILSGTQYALLSEEFAKSRVVEAALFDALNVHVFFGGSDAQNFTLRFSQLFLSSIKNIRLTLVTGAFYKFSDTLEALKKTHPDQVKIYSNTKNMASTMVSCNVAIGAPGITTWERACMGLPSVYLATADNQIPILKQLQQEGFCEFLGMASEIKDEDFVGDIEIIFKNKVALQRMRQISFDAVDGLGATRVASEIVGRFGL